MVSKSYNRKPVDGRTSNEEFEPLRDPGRFSSSDNCFCYYDDSDFCVGEVSSEFIEIPNGGNWDSRDW